MEKKFGDLHEQIVSHHLLKQSKNKTSCTRYSPIKVHSSWDEVRGTMYAGKPFLAVNCSVNKVLTTLVLVKQAKSNIYGYSVTFVDSHEENMCGQWCCPIDISKQLKCIFMSRIIITESTSDYFLC